MYVLYIYSLIVQHMSQISKAKQRILNKSKTGYQFQQSQDFKQNKYPRKFTLSSLTSKFDKRSIRDDLSPPTNHNKFNRTATDAITNLLSANQYDEYHNDFVGYNFMAIEKENPMSNRSVQSRVYSINFKTPLQTHKKQQAANIAAINKQSQIIRMQSPPKLLHKRLLHMQKINLILAPPKKRIHNSPYKPKECDLAYTQKLINQQKQLKQLYTDPQFPPCISIIFPKKMCYQQPGLTFQRLCHIYKNELTILQHSEPTYISLGKYTNPYLYSALCILSQEPSLIASLFAQQEANQYGVYYLGLCKDGVWRYVVVDDYVPVKAAGMKQLLFMHSRQVNGVIQIWPALIQKAIAKIYGTYLDLAMVRNDGMAPFFQILTGSPITQYLINKDFRSYLIVVDAALKRKHIVTVQGIAEEHQETAHLKNLNISQSYRIIDIKKSGLRIRNLAEPELTTKLSFNQCLIFHKLIIYRLQPNYSYLTQKLRHKPKYYSILKLTAPHQTKGYFDIWQNNPAYYKKHLCSSIEYQLSRFKIYMRREEGRDEDGEVVVVEAGKEVQIKEGEYLVHVHLCQRREQDFTVSFYGEHQIRMERQKNMDEWYQDCLCKHNT